MNDVGVCANCPRLTNPDQSEHLGVQSDPFIAISGDGQGHYGSGQFVLTDSDVAKLGPYADANSPTGAHAADQSQFHRNYAWVFHDGVTDEGVAVTRTYAAGGSYPVTLTVTDDGGLTDTLTQNVTVTAPAPPPGPGPGGGVASPGNAPGRR